MIDKISNINSIVQQNKNSRAVNEKSPKVSGNDSVTISMEAQKASELSKIANAIKNNPDNERADKIREIKMKIQNGDYDNLSPEMLDKMTSRLSAVLFE